MAVTFGVNGFGRMGRLVLRAAIENPALECIQINDPHGTPESMAHLLNHDSVQGLWHQEARVDGGQLQIGGQRLDVSANTNPEETDWSGCDLVLEASGRFKTGHELQPFLEQGVKHVVVCAPVKDGSALNVVMGVNDHLVDHSRHAIVTAASCTTNCLAPVVKVMLAALGIERGSMTTIHSLTNTQRIIDAHHTDLRRARASSTNLIPTTTGSATAIAHIFPELAGKLNGHAVRVPLATASLTDCVFEVSRATTVEEVNAVLREAALGELANVLGYEERPLVSTDFVGDPRSCIVDAASTMVVDGTQVKLYLWYDNEWGYASRAAELLALMAGAARAA